MHKHLAALAVAAASILAACGGGGGGGTAGSTAPAASPAEVAASPEGLWLEERLTLLVTSGGEVWGLEVTKEGAFPVLHQGRLTASGTSFAAATTSHFSSTIRSSGNASGSYVPRASLFANFEVQMKGAEAFDTRYDESYDQAPRDVALLAGSYELNSGGSVVLSEQGMLSGTPNGCSLTGHVSPDPSGKNYYRLSVTFGPAPCAMAERTAEGILLADAQFLGVLIGGVVAGESGMVFGLSRL